MPYYQRICNDCQTLVHKIGPHGPDELYCEGTGGYETVPLYTEQEMDQEIKNALARIVAAQEATR